MEPAHRFSEPEIQEVFARAAAAQERADRESADLGLSMEELQSVGAEAGLDPALVAAAARAVASGEPDDGREALLGLPVGVRRAASLDVPPSDDLWAFLVADLQDTFSARGKTERIGESRIWRNGNLRATLSPSGDGARLRLQSNRREDTQRLLLASAINAAVAVFVATTQSDGSATMVLTLVAAGLALMAVIRQFAWTRTREDQMEAVIARAQRSAGTFAPATEAQPVPAARLDLLDLGDASTEAGRAERRVRS